MPGQRTAKNVLHGQPLNPHTPGAAGARPAAALPASVDGVITPVGEARVPIADDGLLRGDGGFEVLRLYGGRPFALEEHLERLAQTCAGLRLESDFAALRAEIAAVLSAAGPVDALLRLVVTRGGRRIAIVEPIPESGAVAHVATITYAPDRVLDGLKTLSYAANMLAGRLAREQGADEALLVTPHGRVLEGPTWTLFWVTPTGELCTPPLADRILDSITRRRVIELTGATEAVCTLDDLRVAAEAFIASTVREVQPIAAIDAMSYAPVPGPRTQETARLLSARIAAEVSASD